ncbi:MAG: GTPase ObgE [Phycisphaerales bacterium]|nr:GTPase ObgE [Phycisphaerales bacterium]
MFVDSAIITVYAGNGGAGNVSFRREKFEPKGGPAGGDGGRGGDVVFHTDDGINTLFDFRGRPDWEAQGGERGRKKQQHGADGNHLIIRVPPGTLIFDAKTGEQLADLGPNQEYVAARGGHGGFGNEHYKSPTNQTPTYAHPGQEGEVRELRLELKLLADVGLLGLPTAGKSTLLKALTHANPKIAAYPFTTLSPQLGVAELDPTRRLVVADIPGLIEGASQGVGLGIEFLKHIERTKVLVHLLDVMPPDGSDPAANYKTIRKELEQYSAPLAEREEVICLNKLDLLENDAARGEAVKSLRAKLKLGREVRVLPLSGATHIGTRELLELLWTIVQGKASGWNRGPAPRAAGGMSANRRKAAHAAPANPTPPDRDLQLRPAVALKGKAIKTEAKRLEGLPTARTGKPGKKAPTAKVAGPAAKRKPVKQKAAAKRPTAKKVVRKVAKSAARKPAAKKKAKR